jgi:hypothetical protein
MTWVLVVLVYAVIEWRWHGLSERVDALLKASANLLKINADLSRRLAEVEDGAREILLGHVDPAKGINQATREKLTWEAIENHPYVVARMELRQKLLDGLRAASHPEAIKMAIESRTTSSALKEAYAEATADTPLGMLESELAHIEKEQRFEQAVRAMLDRQTKSAA